MSTIHKSLSRSLAIALIAAGTLSHVSNASAASLSTTEASPLSQPEIWKRAKFPWLYPTTNAPSNVQSAPVPSQQEIWERAKFPWKFHAAAVQSDTPSTPVLTQQEIWKQAKFPGLYPTHNR